MNQGKKKGVVGKKKTYVGRGRFAFAKCRISAGKENTFFSFPKANRDGFAHFKQISSNSFGMEDMHGGGDQDFNDLVIAFRFIDVIS